MPSNLKFPDVTSPEYGDGSLEVICEPSDSDSDESGDREEPLLQEGSEVNELYDASDENRDWEDESSDENRYMEEALRDEGSEVVELSDSDLVENGDRENPLLDEGAKVDELSHSDSIKRDLEEPLLDEDSEAD